MERVFFSVFQWHASYQWGEQAVFIYCHKLLFSLWALPPLIFILLYHPKWTPNIISLVIRCFHPSDSVVLSRTFPLFGSTSSLGWKEEAAFHYGASQYGTWSELNLRVDSFLQDALYVCVCIYAELIKCFARQQSKVVVILWLKNILQCLLVLIHHLWHKLKLIWRS